MSKSFTPKVLTANALIEGDVVYYANGDWVRSHAAAELLLDEDHANALLTDAQKQEATLVGPYLADAVETDDGPAPTHFREAFRTRGPSNYAHGKQVEHI